MVRFTSILLTVLIFAGNSSAYSQTFGLGSKPVQVETFSDSVFGLTKITTEKAKTPKIVFKTETVQPVKQVEIVRVSRSPVVRQASSSWTDRSLGSWSSSTLRQHLIGELGSAQHRGQVPSSELVGRSLKELQDIHDNLHEGYSWNGLEVRLAVPQKVQARTVTRTFEVSSSCPGGICPTYQRTSSVRRLFRR